MPRDGGEGTHGHRLSEQISQFQLQRAEEVVLEMGLHGFGVGELLPDPHQLLVIGVGSHRNQRGAGLAGLECAQVVAEDAEQVIALPVLAGQLQQRSEAFTHDHVQRRVYGAHSPGPFPAMAIPHGPFPREDRPVSTMSQARQAARFAAGLYWQRTQVRYRAHIKHDELAQLWTSAGRGDPYAVYDRLRARGPLNPTALGNWSSTSHEICSRVLRDRRFSVRPPGNNQAEDEMNLSFLEMDPPDHTRLRRLVAPAFSPKQMTAWAPRIDKRAQALLDDAGDRFDLVDALAAPLPIGVISELLGVPQERGADFRRYGATIGSALDGVRSLRHASALMAANTALEELFTQLFELRRREPSDDLVSTVVAAASSDSAPVTPAELLPLCVLLLVAGFETTVNLISNTMLALLDHPEQWALLLEDPTLAKDAVEETLRYDPPVQQTARIATEPIDIDGHVVRRGQSVVILIGAANRDPQVHAHPGRFDITRRQHDNLAFSSGIHYCIGAPLAKLEATSAVRVLAERYPTLRPAGRITRRRGTTIRGPLHLPVHG